MWFRRDLRLADNPALLSAVAEANGTAVVPLFVLDPTLWRPAGPSRRAYPAASLADLDSRLGGLRLRLGDPVHEVVAVARAAQAGTVHIARDHGHRGQARDLEVAGALATHGIELVRTGSSYAVPPGRVHNRTHDLYQVFTPYFRTWQERGWPAPVEPPGTVSWIRPLDNPHLEPGPVPEGLVLNAADTRTPRHPNGERGAATGL